MPALRQRLTSPSSPWVGRALALATFVISFVFSYGEGMMTTELAPALLIAAAAAGTVWLTESRPLWAVAAVSALTVLLPLIGSTFSVMDLVIVLVIFRAVFLTSAPVWVLASTSFVLLTITYAWQRYVDQLPWLDPSLLYPAILTALAVGLGAQSRRVVAQQSRLLEYQDAARARAVADERVRIARDLHDVAAHHMTALVVRNRLARRLATAEALESAAEFTASTAAETLRGLREVVHLLGSDDGAPLGPGPDLAALEAVVSRMGEVGLVVHHAPFDFAPMPSQVEETIVRIVQESLANVLRHRGPGQSWLTIDRGPDTVTVTVEDDGAPTGDRSAGDEADLSGRGLAGMIARVAQHGGTLTSGRSPRGGFLVSATLPVEA